MKENQAQEWTEIIRPVGKGFKFKFTEVWKYRDLIYLFVHRNFVSQFKQTILGPSWHLIQPLLTTIMFTIVFGKIAKIPTDGVPPFIFYMAGTVIWTYFSNILAETSSTFTSNSHIFGKVYFPRLVMPISVLFSKLIAFSIQFLFFICFIFYFKYKGSDIEITIYAWFTPILIIMMAMFGLGLGVIVSALTTRYRDLTILVGFGIQLFMYVSPVIYPISSLPERWQFYASLNPVAPIIETFRVGYLGSGTFSFVSLAISFFIIIVIMMVGILIFNKIERNFMDTV